MSKPSNKHIVHNKAGDTHILVGILLSFMRGAVYRNQAGCCGETLMLLSHIYEKQRSKCVTAVWFVILPFIDISYVTMATRHVCVHDDERNKVTLSLPEQVEDMW